jgi:putative signal transducing protein
MSDPRFVEDPELATATFVQSEVEAEMVRGLLESAGIPSIIQAAGMFEGSRHGFGGVPVYGGAQKVLVHAHRLEEAQTVIASAQSDEDGSELGFS